MSYPPVRYQGKQGQATAVLRSHDEVSDIVYENGVKVDYLATGAQTDSEFGLYRWNFGPGETGPGPHFHRTISESFYILTGTVRLFDGNVWVDAVPGDFLYIPKGGVHGFRNVADEPASMLLMFTPGAPREEYFETLLEFQRGLELSPEERDDFFIRHDNHDME